LLKVIRHARLVRADELVLVGELGRRRVVGVGEGGDGGSKAGRDRSAGRGRDAEDFLDGGGVLGGGKGFGSSKFGSMAV
jgi:hypothetical protein